MYSGHKESQIICDLYKLSESPNFSYKDIFKFTENLHKSLFNSLKNLVTLVRLLISKPQSRY